MSPILFVMFIDRISRHSHGVDGIGFGGLRISSLLFFQLLLRRFAAECEAAGMRITTYKSEAMVLSRTKGVPTSGWE